MGTCKFEISRSFELIQILFSFWISRATPQRFDSCLFTFWVSVTGSFFDNWRVNVHGVLQKGAFYKIQSPPYRHTIPSHLWACTQAKPGLAYSGQCLRVCLDLRKVKRERWSVNGWSQVSFSEFWDEIKHVTSKIGTYIKLKPLKSYMQYKKLKTLGKKKCLKNTKTSAISLQNTAIYFQTWTCLSLAQSLEILTSNQTF